MKKSLSLLHFVCLAGLYSIICSCGGNAGEDRTPGRQAKKKGRIWDKVNIVQIPLTAAENNLHGKVRTVRYVDYKFIEKNGQSEKVLDDSGYNVYDNFGNLVDQNEYSPEGKPKWKCIYQYDSNNRAVKWDFNFIYRNVKEITTFRYSKEGRKIESNSVSGKANDSRRTIYQYDANGNEIQETVYLRDGSIYSITTSKYDKTGNQVEMAWSVTGQRAREKETASYDEYGNKITTSRYNGDTIQLTSVQTFDNKGRELEASYSTGKGTFQGRSTYKYDDWDNLTQYVSYTADNTIDTTGWNVAYEYEYDQAGNKTRETAFRVKEGKRIPDYYTEATYTYYE